MFSLVILDVNISEPLKNNLLSSTLSNCKFEKNAFFSNLQLDKVEDSKLFFSGSDMFTSRITSENIDDLIVSLNKVGYKNYEVVIEATEAAVKTPSTAWEKKRKEEIIAFKKEILESDLLVNLKHNFGEEITQDKFQVIDHEE